MSTYRMRGVYAITDTTVLRENALLAACEAALRGGASALQYRDKSSDAARREHEAGSLVKLCERYGVPLIVNDDLALAAAVGAHGVHLGRNDVDVAVARDRLGPHVLIGISCYNNLARAVAAQAGGADYIAFGSFFTSTTKPQAVRADAALIRQARRECSLPLVAIGGITPENGASLVQAGADMLAIVSGIFSAADPRAATARYAALFAPIEPNIPERPQDQKP